MRMRTLLDPSFQHRLTPALLPAVYLFLTGVVVLGGAGAVVVAFAAVWWLGVVAVVVVPVVALGLVAVIRVLCELVLGFSVVADHTEAMAAGLRRVETTVDGVAEDMPRIGFLRGPKKSVG
jgi:O-antigen ligase